MQFYKHSLIKTNNTLCRSHCYKMKICNTLPKKMQAINFSLNVCVRERKHTHLLVKLQNIVSFLTYNVFTLTKATEI